MKIVNGKLTYEQVTCWDCNGKKEVTRYNLCPHTQKQVRQFGGKCPHCGAKNKWSHQTVGQRQEPCHTCGAKGTRMQTAYDMVSSEEMTAMLPHFKFTVVRGPERCSNFNESYLGLGIVAGYTDYNNWNLKSDEEIIAAAKASMVDRHSQPVNHIVKRDSDVVATEILIKPLTDGFSAYARWA